MDFLLSVDPFHFETVLLSHVDSSYNYERSPFQTMIIHIELLRKYIDNVKYRVRKRFSMGLELSREHKSFESVLIETFHNRTMLDYLMNGDLFELDFLFLSIEDNYPAFTFNCVTNVSFRLCQLQHQIENVMNKLCRGYMRFIK